MGETESTPSREIASTRGAIRGFLSHILTGSTNDVASTFSDHDPKPVGRATLLVYQTNGTSR
jgi:hypothetical protein